MGLRRLALCTLVLCDVKIGSTNELPQSEEEHLRLLLNAWATTGSCNASRFRGRCGVVAALYTPDFGTTPLIGQAAAGLVSHPNSAAFDSDTLFEIASITKVFTAVVLRRLVVEGNLSMTDKIGPLLPPLSYKTTSTASITLQELVTHTSGLPEMPPNLVCDNCSNPFTGYTAEDLYSCLEDLGRLPSRGRFLYTNFGFGLLGYLLELRAGMPYEQLVKEKLLAPLGMHDTKIKLTESEWQTVARGLDASGNFAERLGPYGVLQGQGAFHSSLRDLAAFLSSSLAAAAGRPGSLPSALAEALRLSAAPLAPDEFLAEHGEVASGWQLYRASGSATVWKSGGSAGYGSLAAVDVASGRAAVAMESCGNCGAKAVDQLVRLLVDAPRREPRPAAAALPAYTGCFRLPAMASKNRQPRRNASIVSVTLEEGRLRLEVGGGGAALIPFESKPSGSPVFAFDPQRDDVCLRPSGQGPLELANLRHGRREMYFADSDLSTLVLHVDGWDLFAPRISCGGVDGQRRRSIIV